mmetsp:Transcript_13057/g.19729  ORF Transcript_13057/g.19729 Transcript_13057/m.19729 type:complete len:272 (-) Transcript_13057:432-1247(-)
MSNIAVEYERWSTLLKTRLQLLEKFPQLKLYSTQSLDISCANVKPQDDEKEPILSSLFPSIPKTEPLTYEKAITGPNDAINQCVSLYYGNMERLFDQVHVVVNSAHSHLNGGSGVDGIVHKHLGGQDLIDYAKKHHGDTPLTIGETFITPLSFRKPNYIIHTLAPGSSLHNWPKLLASCYYNVLNALKQLDPVNSECKVIIPCLGTGGHGLNREESAHIALGEIRLFLENAIKETNRNYLIIICVYSSDMLTLYEQLMSKIYFPPENEKKM